MHEKEEGVPLQAKGGMLDGDRLKESIRNSGYKLQELANHLGIDRGTLRHYLHGDTSMPVSVRTQLFQLLGYSSSDFVAQTRSVPIHTEAQYAMVQFKQAREPALEIDLFDLKSQVIHALIKQWYGRGTYCEQLQILISQELQMFDLLQSFYPSEKYTISRRDVLAALAASPLLLLQSKRIVTKPHPEEWLPHCTASVTACWYLLNGDGDDLSTIEKTLRMYLPSLLDLARQSSSRYQKTAAALAAQSFLLLDLVSYHRTQFANSLQYANEAVRLAEIAADPTLSVYALLLSGGAYNLNQQHAKMLQQHQAAARCLPSVLPAVRSYVYAQLAYAHAQNGQSDEASLAIQEARAQFPPHFGMVPCFIETDYNQAQLVIFEALTFLSIGTHAQKQEPYKKAARLLEQAEAIPEQNIPLRSRVELLNYQAQAAIGLGDLDSFEQYCLAGLQGAHILKSQKRMDEVRANCQTAKGIWQDEHRIRLLECQIRG